MNGKKTILFEMFSQHKCLRPHLPLYRLQVLLGMHHFKNFCIQIYFLTLTVTYIVYQELYPILTGGRVDVKRILWR